MHTTSAFAALAVRGLDYPFTIQLSLLRCLPSSLYTFPIARAWLGITP